MIYIIDVDDTSNCKCCNDNDDIVTTVVTSTATITNTQC